MACFETMGQGPLQSLIFDWPRGTWGGHFGLTLGCFWGPSPTKWFWMKSHVGVSCGMMLWIMSLGTLFYFFGDEPSENSEGQWCKRISIAQLSSYLFQKRLLRGPLPKT